MQCAQCQEDFPRGAKPRAAICIFALGDEVIFTYWFCPSCRHYTVGVDRDRFMGEVESWVLAPVSEEVGDRCVALVRACPRPSDKLCTCDSHKALYYGVPRGWQGE